MKHSLHTIQAEAERVQDAVEMALKYDTPHFQKEAEKAQERFEQRFPDEDWRGYQSSKGMVR